MIEQVLKIIKKILEVNGVSGIIVLVFLGLYIHQSYLGLETLNELKTITKDNALRMNKTEVRQAKHSEQLAIHTEQIGLMREIFLSTLPNNQQKQLIK